MKKAFKNNIYMLRTVFKYSPGLVLYTIASAAFFALTKIFAQFIILRKILQSIERSESFENIILVNLIGLFIILLLRGGVELLQKYFVPVYSNKFKKGFESYLYKKVSTFDLQCYDDTKFFNDYIWTMHNATELTLKGVKSIGESLNQLFQLMGVMVIILSIDFVMALIIAISVVISIVINMFKDKAKLDYKKALVPSEKEKKYVERLFYLKDSAKDVRLTSIKNKFDSFYNKAYEKQFIINKRMTRKIAWLAFIPVSNVCFSILRSSAVVKTRNEQT